jgi:hypothetical protein
MDQELAEQVRQAASGQPANEPASTDRGDNMEAQQAAPPADPPVEDAQAAPAADPPPSTPHLDPPAQAPEENLAGVPASENEPKGVAIPKTRFDAVNQRRKDAEQHAAALQEELDKLRAAPVAPAPAAPAAPVQAQPSADERLIDLDIANAQNDIRAAMNDGDADKLAEANQKLVQAQFAKVQAQNVQPAPVQESQPQTVKEIMDEIAFNTALDTMKANYPVLDESSDLFDGAVVTEVNRLYQAFTAAGTAKADALKTAVAYVKPPQPTAPAQQTPEQIAANTQRNVRNAQQQAPDISQAGGDIAPGSVNYDNISPDEFKALPEAVKARDRGDHFVPDDS